MEKCQKKKIKINNIYIDESNLQANIREVDSHHPVRI